ncbi:GIY-YIG nuclease family protein [Desulfolutivibrio sp.]|uniref:GIY-YIG nuclease family protein n=1 Tax=Desulfolutivibrio sp. TaxID=2773296 RepID=UPI002F96E46E
MGCEMTDACPWFVYLLECSDGTLYCGITRDIARRLKEHNGMLAGGARYTRSRRPVELAASVAVSNRAEAAKIEWRVKRLPRNKKHLFLQGVSLHPSGTACESGGHFAEEVLVLD